MEQRIVDFTEYLRNDKKSSENTVLSYARDLKGFSRFMKESGVLDPAKVNRTNVMAYVYELQKQNKAGATVSRNIASIRSFFQFLQKKGVVALLFQDLIKVYNELGFKYAETNAMLENNQKIQSMFDTFEREIHKRRWVFGKEI